MNKYSPEHKDPYEYAQLNGHKSEKSTIKKPDSGLDAGDKIPSPYYKTAIEAIASAIATRILLKLYTAVRLIATGVSTPAAEQSPVAIAEDKPISDEEAAEFALEMAQYMRPV